MGFTEPNDLDRRGQPSIGEIQQNIQDNIAEQQAAEAAASEPVFDASTFDPSTINWGGYFDDLSIGIDVDLINELEASVTEQLSEEAVKPITEKPVATKPVVTKPVVTKPVVTKPVVTKPVVTKPITEKPVPITEKPVVTKPQVEPTENDNIFNGQQQDSGSEADVFDLESFDPSTINWDGYFDNSSISVDLEVLEEIEEVQDAGETLVSGCTDPKSTNYNPKANVSTDTCVYNSGSEEKEVKPTKNNIAVMALAAVAILLALGKK